MEVGRAGGKEEPQASSQFLFRLSLRSTPALLVPQPFGLGTRPDTSSKKTGPYSLLGYLGQGVRYPTRERSVKAMAIVRLEIACDYKPVLPGVFNSVSAHNSAAWS